jgi:hypothetical protein
VADSACHRALSNIKSASLRQDRFRNDSTMQDSLVAQQPTPPESSSFGGVSVH